MQSRKKRKQREKEKKMWEGSIYKLMYGFSFPFTDINLQKNQLKLGKLGINQLYFYVPAHNDLKIKAIFMKIFSNEKVLIWHVILIFTCSNPVSQCIILKHLKYDERLTLRSIFNAEVAPAIKMTHMNDYWTNNVHRSVLLMIKLAHTWTQTSIGK